ncbi:MAG TPA: ATP-binding protein [Acidimicrobiales bacterium]
MSRSRHLTARFRLTVLYTVVFVALGVVLLAANYRLLAHHLATGTSSVSIGEVAPNQPTFTAPPSSAVQASSGSPVVSVGQYRQDTLRHLLWSSVVTLVVGAALAAVAVWVAAGRALRPLERMSATARRVSEEHLAERIPLSGPHDELFDLALTFNETLDRLAGALARERQLVANTSHELRTPLANQRTMLEVSLADPTADHGLLRHACQTALAQSLRAEAIIEAMLALSGAQYAQCDMRSIRLDQLVDRMLGSADLAGMPVDVELEPVTVLADELYCELAVVNLLNNAVRHNVDDGWLAVSVCRTTTGVELVVANSTATTTSEQLSTLREPFRRGTVARTRSDRGAGLGLTIVEAITRVHGWTLLLETPTNQSFRVTVSAPHVD